MGLGLPQPLQHCGNNDRQSDGRIDEHLSETSAFGRGYEFSPRDGLAIGTSRQAAPIHRLGTDAQAVVIALQRQVLAQSAVPQFDERAELLRPVPRNSAAYGEN